MADYDDEDELFKDLYGDDDNGGNASAQQPPPSTVTPANLNASTHQAPPPPPPATAEVERATDPRKQPPQQEQYHQDDDNQHDPDREFARNGSTQMTTPPPLGQSAYQQQMNNSHEHSENRDTRPNPNKHDDGKMFIGGLNWETTDESLRAYFEQFGEITECTVMRENQTGRSRGFGFLTFKDPKVVNTVMVKEHVLDGKIIDPKRAIPRDEQDRTSKIFVGGIGQDVVEEEFKEYFEQFGTVLDATLMMDKETGRPRGFGFVTFDDDSAVENCMSRGPLAIKGKMIEVKRAQPKGREREEPRPGFQQRGGFGGPGGGQGGQPFGGQNGLGGPGMMNPMYGGMSPAMMAQIYQRMQAYYAAAMGRGMMPMGAPMMGMPNMPMQGMPGMNPAMMGMPPQGMPGYQGQMPMGPQGGYPQQGFGSPEPSSHEGEYTYDNSDQGGGYAPQSPPAQMGGEMPPSGPRDGVGPPPNAPTGPSGGSKPSYGRGRGSMRGGRGGQFQGGMARGGNVRYNPYAR